MELEENRKQGRRVTIFAIILSVISIALLIIGFKLVSSDKVVMLQSVSKLVNKFNGAFENNNLFDKIAASKDIGLKANINLTYDEVDANLVINYLENKAQKKSKLDVDFSVDNQNLLGLEGILTDEKGYFYVDDITPTYYYTALEYVSVLSSLKSNDYDKVFTLLKDTVTDYISDAEIEKEKVEITYNGKSKKVNKLTYAITNQAISEMASNFVEALKKDKSLLESIASYINKTNEEVISELDSFINKLIYEEVEVGCYYNVYYYGFNKIVKYELTDVDKNIVIEYKVEDGEAINFYDSGIQIMSLEVTKNKSQYDFKGFIKDIDEGTELPFVGNLKGNTLTINVEQDGVLVTLAITSTEEIKENSYVYKNKFELSGMTDDIEVTVATIDIDLEYYFGEKVNVNLSNSVDVDLMTEEDLTTIQNNILNHPIYQLIMGMVGTMGISL